MMQWLRELLKSSYVRRLEEENARLLQENRALLNSLLGIAGHNPVEFPAAPATPPKGRVKLSWHQLQRRTERRSEDQLIQRAQAQRANEPPKPVE
jgi:hypothetical protein